MISAVLRRLHRRSSHDRELSEEHGTDGAWLNPTRPVFSLESPVGEPPIHEEFESRGLVPILDVNS